ncbi:hypothetical protein ACGFX4_38320 [Kitasatospora sp. NPDC048365]|uniref:hypothetical protein n=1 Tax=Kitasatospora sp. NPDC048365 TaxID=3364050 RepID=UPI003719111F
MSLPAEVTQTVTTFLSAVDRSAPGLVEGLYLCGSLGFGEYVAGHSDVDFVAVLAERPGRAALDALAAAHATVRAEHPRPHFDGLHAVRADLARSPDECPDLPCTQNGEYREAGRFGVNPVTWHELARHSVPVRGSRLTDADVWTDDAALRAYSHRNLSEYWSGTAAAIAANPQAAAGPFAAEWCVLGVSRLHHLLATGTLTTKSGAGRYALTAFEPYWHPIITEALALREGSPSSYGEDTARRGADTVAFTAMAIEAGLALPAPAHGLP